jgi:hypothetical protein
VIVQPGYDRLRSPRHSRSRSLGVQEERCDTPEVSEALDFLEPYIRPTWLVPQFRNNLERTPAGPLEVSKEGQQQVLRATFRGIRDAIRELLGVRADALARKFHETHDMAVKDELERLLKEYGKLREPWMFVSK